MTSPAQAPAAETERERRALARWDPRRRWYQPAVTTTVIAGSRVILGRLNPLSVEGREQLDALRERGGRGLLTFSNHVSLFDDPLITSNLSPLRYHGIRWVAADALNFFGNGWKAWLFSTGKCVPVVRGAGTQQPGLDFLRDRLAGGDWVHVFPEGGRTRDPRALLRSPFRAGIGRLIDETRPLALPFYHHGMQRVLPVGALRPRTGARVRVRFGAATSCDDAFVANVTARAAGPRERWEALARWAHGELRQLELLVHPDAADGT